MRRAGVSDAEAERMAYAQDYRCAICRETHLVPRAMCVDHCHATGRVRGLLCNACNLGLGHFKDDPHRLREAAAYVERT